MTETPKFTYSRWRHGGWYVHGIKYPSGAIGCVSNNYADRKWRIACDPRPFEQQPTFKTREEAALAEWRLANEMRTARAVAVENMAAAATGAAGDVPQLADDPSRAAPTAALQTFEVVPWWDVQRGCDPVEIEAASAEDAARIAWGQIESGEIDLSESEEFGDSDGATRIDVYVRADGRRTLVIEGDDGEGPAAPSIAAQCEAFVRRFVATYGPTFAEKTDEDGCTIDNHISGADAVDWMTALLEEAGQIINPKA